MPRITIKRDSVKRTKHDGKWRITVKVCSDFAEPKTVEVRSNPYDTNGVKFYRPNEIVPQTVTVPANGCVDVVFDYDKEPSRSYTDAKFPGAGYGYEDGEETDFVKKQTAVGESSSPFLIVAFQTPYPWRLADKDGPGQTATFVIASVAGLPAGWTATVLYPGLNVQFQRTDPDRESQGVMRIDRPLSTAEGTVVIVTVLQRVVGQPDEPVNRFESQYLLVADTTPPTVASSGLTPNMAAKTILATVEASDPVSDILSVDARFSTDGGISWSTCALTAPQSQVYDVVRTYSVTLGPFGAGQAVTVEAVLVDNLGNRTTAPLGTVQF